MCIVSSSTWVTNAPRTWRVSSLHRWELQAYSAQKSNANWYMSPAGTIHQKYWSTKSASSSSMKKSIQPRYVNAVVHHSDRVSSNDYYVWQVVDSWNLRALGFNLKCSLLTPLDQKKCGRVLLKRNVDNWMIMKRNNFTLQVQSKNYA